MKRLSIFIFALLFALNASAQILYKISGNGLTKPSYIMGTYHLISLGELPNVKPLDKIVQEVEQFCGEFNLEESMKVNKLLQERTIDDSYFLPYPKTLKDIFTPEEYAEIDLCTKEISGYSINNLSTQLQLPGIERLMPRNFGSLLSMIMLTNTINASGGEFVSIDDALLRMGAMLYKPVIGLETAGFQLDLLSNPEKKSLQEEKALLLYVIRHWDEQVAMVVNLKEAYMKQDLAAMNRILSNQKDMAIMLGLQSPFNSIFNERDADWARRMPAIMRDKSTFFFVGVGHLAGDPGVLNLLRQQGFTVEPLQ